jgi:hypothetical protein
LQQVFCGEQTGTLRKDRQDNHIQRNIPSIFGNKLISLVSGVLAEMIVRTFCESQGKTIYNVRSIRNMEEAVPTIQRSGVPG